MLNNVTFHLPNGTVQFSQQLSIPAVGDQVQFNGITYAVKSRCLNLGNETPFILPVGNWDVTVA